MTARDSAGLHLAPTSVTRCVERRLRPDTFLPNPSWLRGTEPFL